MIKPHPYQSEDELSCEQCGLPHKHVCHEVDVSDVPDITEPRVAADDPALPYDGNTSSGHSGSEASRERAQRRDADGSTSKVQQALLGLARSGVANGLTVAEARQHMITEHHGTISGALSNLHEHGNLLRLRDKRGRCSIYVLPEYAFDRETVPHGHRASRLTAEDHAVLAEAQRYAETAPSTSTRQHIDRLVGLVQRLNA